MIFKPDKHTIKPDKSKKTSFAKNKGTHILESLVFKRKNRTISFQKMLTFSFLLPILSASHALAEHQKSSLSPQPDISTQHDGFKLLTYNVFMLPRVVSNWAPDTRAKNLIKSPIFEEQDLVILNELFDEKASRTLTQGLLAKYPFQTPVVGVGKFNWDKTLGEYSSSASTSGGVSILSKYPILEKEQYIYSDACGFDALSNKGFAYVKINKNGTIFHVIGTHTQADDDLCTGVTPASIRTKQFNEITQFITSKNINRHDVVFIAGDLNVNKGTAEYTKMFETLKVNVPHISGHESTWDPSTNDIAKYKYPMSKGEYLDYILISNRHAQPSFWQNQALDLRGEEVNFSTFKSHELSDHYPVLGFSYADTNTRTKSIRPINSPYNNVRFYNQGNGKLISAHPRSLDGWLTMHSDVETINSSFSIQGYLSSVCFKHNDYIQIESNKHKDFFWNWSLRNAAGNYGYYTAYKNPSRHLKLYTLDKTGDCLRDGDVVAFKDLDTIKNIEYFVSRISSGNWNNHMFLWYSDISSNEQFKVFGIKPFEYDPWEYKLVYNSEEKH